MQHCYIIQKLMPPRQLLWMPRTSVLTLYSSNSTIVRGNYWRSLTVCCENRKSNTAHLIVNCLLLVLPFVSSVIFLEGRCFVIFTITSHSRLLFPKFLILDPLGSSAISQLYQNIPRILAILLGSKALWQTHCLVQLLLFFISLRFI